MCAMKYFILSMKVYCCVFQFIWL